MSETTVNHQHAHPLRAFVRGAWILLLVQLTVALLVFGAISYGSLQLNGILRETAQRQAELQTLRAARAKMESSIAELERGLRNAHAATPIVRSAIIAFHNRRYEEAVEQYREALRLDASNAYVRDLMSYSLYMAGRAALGAGARDVGDRHLQDAVAAVRHVLQQEPDYLGGYVELAIYECARNQESAAIAAYEAALARSHAASDAFASRLPEIPQRCAMLRSRVTGRSSPERRTP